MNRNVLFLVLFVTVFTVQKTFAQESVSTLLQKAKTQAQAENKAILVKFEASWCGWCKKMTRDMKAPSTKQFFDDNFVIVPVVVFEFGKNKNLENPGCYDLIQEYNGATAGLPFWVILDQNGKVITNSYAGGQNLGGPSTLKEVRLFIRKLRKVVPKLTKQDKDAILAQFVKKKKKPLDFMKNK
jgi:thioredoxin-related protein